LQRPAGASACAHQLLTWADLTQRAPCLVRSSCRLSTKRKSQISCRAFGPESRRGVAAAIALGLACSRQRPARGETSPSTPILRGKVAVVTGANTGIGKATAAGLARSGQYGLIFLAGHNEEKTKIAIDQLTRDLPKPANGAEPVKFEFLPLELSSLDSVRSAAKAFQAKQLPLHTLVCNAAVMALPERKTTSDGYEFQFEVNYLSHFLLTNLLLPQLTASGTSDDPARVISVSSGAHFVRSPLAFGDVSDLNLAGGEGDAHAYYPWTAYGQSKLAQVMFTYELTRRLGAQNTPVVANVLDPGFVDTELQRYLPAQAPAPAMKFIAKTAEAGASTPVLLATTDAGRTKGGFWIDGKEARSLGRGSSPFPLNPELAVPGSTSYDESAWKALWAESAKLAGLNDTI